MKKLIYKIFGTRNDRLLKQYTKLLLQINALEPQIKLLTNDDLRAKTQQFKQQYRKTQNLMPILPEAFAVCREASSRVLGMRPFDVQLLGAIALHEGKIAEMRTGEGKTLVGTIAAYLDALSDDGVHIVTVNDYLAKRDSAEMGKLFNFLDMTVGLNLTNMSQPQKNRHILVILLMVLTMSLVLIIYVII
jgi:preprotein translocase subunit SecA